MRDSLQSLNDGYGLTLQADADDPERYAVIVKFGGAAAQAGMQTFLDYVTGVEIEQVGTPSKRWVYPFAFLLIGLLVLSQMTRIRKDRESSAARSTG